MFVVYSLCDQGRGGDTRKGEAERRISHMGDHGGLLSSCQARDPTVAAGVARGAALVDVITWSGARYVHTGDKAWGVWLALDKMVHHGRGRVTSDVLLVCFALPSGLFGARHCNLPTGLGRYVSRS